MPTLGARSAIPAHTQEVPILGLHQEDPTAVVKAILRRGFTPVWLNEVIDALNGKGSLPAQPVALTLDDGDPSWFTTSHPVFQTYGVKATLCVTSDYLYQVDLVPFSNTGITWAQARTMRDSGLYDWQNHTKTHTAFTSLSSAQIAAELAACNAAIVSELGVRPPRALIYPHGAYNAQAAQAVRDAGFDIGLKFGDNPLTVAPGAAPFVLNRAHDPANLLLWSRQAVLYDFGHDMTGGRNAANALGFWSFPPEGSLTRSGLSLTIDSTASANAASIISADYFRASGALLSTCGFGTSSHTTGTAKVSVRQYDVDRAPLATIDVLTASANLATTNAINRIPLDPACAFVRLEISADAAFNGVADVFNWTVRADR